MDRIVKAFGGVLTVYFEGPDGTPTDPTSPTVVITAEDGTVVQASTSATAAADSTGKVTYTATPTHASRLDLWTVTWTGTVGGAARTLTTYADVCGGHLFDIQALKAELQTPAKYTQDQYVRVRNLAEDAFENACGVAFVPRFKSQTLSGNGSDLLLVEARSRTVRSASIDSTSVTDTMTADRAGTVYLSSGWTSGTDNVLVRYEHGYDTPPNDVSRAVLLLAKHWLTSSISDPRATSETNEYGTFSLATPGLRGSYFGLPDVDSVVDRYRVAVGVA